MAKNKIEEWYNLEWKDEAEHTHTMNGPHYALVPHAEELKKAGIDYKLREIGWMESVEHD